MHPRQILLFWNCAADVLDFWSIVFCLLLSARDGNLTLAEILFNRYWLKLCYNCAIMSRKYLYFFAGIVLLALIGAGVVIFSSRTAVAVSFTSVTDQTLEIGMSEQSMSVDPGVTERVIYKVTNPGTEPLNVIANLEYEPASAEFQVRVFQTDCGKWTVVNPGQTIEFETIFSLLPSGPFGSDKITMRHVFKKP